MIRRLSKARVGLILSAGGLLLLGVVAACSSTPPATTGPATTAPASAGLTWPYPAPQKGSAQLWAETCNRCHNIRSPSAYSSAQWAVIMYDMRMRCSLTGQEQRQILEFLQSAH